MTSQLDDDYSEGYCGKITVRSQFREIEPHFYCLIAGNAYIASQESELSMTTIRSDIAHLKLGHHARIDCIIVTSIPSMQSYRVEVLWEIHLVSLVLLSPSDFHS